ncbi:exonuclease mut-7 homolog isoform X2 [Argiope bruennichi]|uniref:exonuclease mut-7 homolog isoform X2 n=1 Tax=Argiope bruennichi TaxID=94029 RepID=UPI002494EF37|nr:exonuclease mut-7 homolog isoform X2 [Argiope bruennichi]
MQNPENKPSTIPYPYIATLEDHLKRNKTLNNVLFNILDKQTNQFSFVMDLFYNSHQKYPKKGKPGKLPIAILESFKDWCKSRNISNLPTKRQKIEALNKVLLFSSANCIKLVCEIFHLEEEKEHVKYVASRLLSEKRFMAGYHLISALNLESEIPLESCVFPLFFLGHDSCVKAYLNKTPHLQSHFIRTLDNLSKNGFVLREFVDSLGIESVKPKGMIIDTKWVLKRFPSLIEYFNINIKDCPNLYHTRVGGAMAYLFRRMYYEESIDYEPWEEMMFDTVKDHLGVQKALLVKLININEFAVAFRFAELFRMNKNDWPDIMKTVPYPGPIFPIVKTNPIPDNYIDYLALRLNRSDVHLVDTPEKLIEAVDDISENYNMVGLDCEWKPSLGIFKEKAALCQLAVWDSVYLFDILALKEYQSKQIWEYLLRKIFYNEEITKLGYGGINDLKVLIETIGYEKESKQDYRSVVDLLAFFKKLKTHYPEISEEIENWHPSLGDDQKGLSQLCKTVLGRPLDKAEQFSNWEKRPLRERQIFYAALDAYCLLMIYEKIYPVLKKHGLDLNKVLQTKQTPFKAQKPKAVVQSKLSNEPLAIKDFKVVVDTTVGGVTKYLRLLGADVVTLNEGDDHMRAVQIAQCERRVIITAGAAYKKLSGYVPPGMCFCVDNLLMAKQQVSQILDYYKVECQDSDIFSRCTEESDDDTVPGDKDKTINDIPVTNEDGHQISGSSVQKSFLQFEVADSEDEDDLDSIYY